MVAIFKVGRAVSTIVEVVEGRKMMTETRTLEAGEEEVDGIPSTPPVEKKVAAAQVPRTLGMMLWGRRPSPPSSTTDIVVLGLS